MSNDLVLVSTNHQGVATVTLNNPEKHNAFNDEIIALLTQTFKQLAQDDDVRILVLTSKGKSFSAGADLTWMKKMAQYSFDENLHDATLLADMLKQLNFFPKPTIAQIQGAAFGGAIGLASCCDIVVASEKASFCLSEVKIGLIPATISPYVINAIGLKAARRYFQTAERFSAYRAQQLGLVDEVVAPEHLESEVNRFVNQLLANSPSALTLAKTLVFDVANQPITPALIKDTSERIASIRTSAEGQEGLSAFFEKRPPNWQHNH